MEYCLLTVTVFVDLSVTVIESIFRTVATLVEVTVVADGTTRVADLRLKQLQAWEIFEQAKARNPTGAPPQSEGGVGVGFALAAGKVEVEVFFAARSINAPLSVSTGAAPHSRIVTTLLNLVTTFDVRNGYALSRCLSFCHCFGWKRYCARPNAHSLCYINNSGDC